MIKRIPDCHPDRPYKAKGLCNSCYFQQPAMRKTISENAKKHYREKAEAEGRTVRRTNLTDTERKEYKNNWNHKNAREAILKHRYNLTIGQYDALVAKQNGVCAICKQPPRGKMKRLSVDHNHQTGEVRGLLCITCNRVLGYFENPEWHWSANKYLAEGMPQTAPIEPSSLTAPITADAEELEKCKTDPVHFFNKHVTSPITTVPGYRTINCDIGCAPPRHSVRCPWSYGAR